MVILCHIQLFVTKNFPFGESTDGFSVVGTQFKITVSVRVHVQNTSLLPSVIQPGFFIFLYVILFLLLSTTIILTLLKKKARYLLQNYIDRGINSVGAASGNFSYRKSTIGTSIAAIEVNNDMYCLQKTNRKVPTANRKMCPARLIFHVTRRLDSVKKFDFQVFLKNLM